MATRIKMTSEMCHRFFELSDAASKAERARFNEWNEGKATKGDWELACTLADIASDKYFAALEIKDGKDYSD